MNKKIIMMVLLLSAAGMTLASLVTIGNPGNAADTADGDSATAGVQRYGAVGYTYKISATEVTIAEFTASGAGGGNENFWNTAGKTVGTNAPASRVTLYEAMKYCNWLTTGNTNSGYYSTSDGGVTYQANALSHDAYAAVHGRTYFVPTENEWYKAAYFKPNATGYSLYANGSSTTPIKSTDGSTGWNYNNAATNWMATASPWTVDKGTMEQNGTFNMMGNVREWVEDPAGVNRGGNSINNLGDLGSTWRIDAGLLASQSQENWGFRVVEIIPEPATVGMLGLGALITLLLRKIRA